MNDEKEYDDWTQICFSMKDAVQAAAKMGRGEIIYIA